MGLKINNIKLQSDFDTILTFGQCEGLTIEEVIDDGQCSLIMFYINKGIIFPTENLRNEMIMNCRGGCPTCINNF